MTEPITSLKIQGLVDDALKQFGAYPFTDKGPREVMDLRGIVEELNKLPAEQCASILVELWNVTKKNGDYCRIFVSAALMGMQDVPDDRWEVLMSNPDLEKAFN